MKNRKKITIILLVILFIGLLVLFYPNIANYWNLRHQSRAVVTYEEKMKDMDEADYSGIFAKADRYNTSLAALGYPLTQYDQVRGYKDAVNIDGKGMIGYISISKIQIRLPIYHGVKSDILNYACGHMEGTSLPVGGPGTHSVLSAHRGLPTATLFTNLNKLEIGDTFVITVLDREITYEVDQIKVVLPEDMNDISIEDGKDYCTLLTCTPYGINTHRLLVRGTRIETKAHRSVVVTSDAGQIDRLIVTPVVAMPILAALIIYVCVKPAKKKLPIEGSEESKGEEDL